MAGVVRRVVAATAAAWAGSLVLVSLWSSGAAGTPPARVAPPRAGVPGQAWLPPAMPSAPVAAPVSDTTTTTPPAAPSAAAPDIAPGFEQRLGAAALARISYPWARLGYSI